MAFLDKLGFKKLKDGLAKTKDDLFGKVNRLINAKKKIDDEFINQLEEIFLLSDMGYDTTQTIIENIKLSAKENKYEGEDELNRLITDEIKKVISTNTSEFNTFSFDITSPYTALSPACAYEETVASSIIFASTFCKSLSLGLNLKYWSSK